MWQRRVSGPGSFIFPLQVGVAIDYYRLFCRPGLATINQCSPHRPAGLSSAHLSLGQTAEGTAAGKMASKIKTKDSGNELSAVAL